jgi:hypothetical protein
MLADGYNPSEIIQVFAEDVEIPPEQLDPVELTKSIPSLIEREIEKREKARAAAEAAAAAETKTRKEAEDKAAAEAKSKEDQATREEYYAECAKDLKAHAEKFPLCNAWVHRISIEKVVAVASAFAKTNGRAPTGEELFPAIEAEFQAELEKATGTRVKELAKEVQGQKPLFSDDVFAELDRKLLQKDPSIPAGTAAHVQPSDTGNPVMDEIYKELLRLDNDRKSRVSYDG